MHQTIKESAKIWLVSNLKLIMKSNKLVLRNHLFKVSRLSRFDYLYFFNCSRNKSGFQLLLGRIDEEAKSSPLVFSIDVYIK